MSNELNEKLEQEHKRYLGIKQKVSNILAEFGDAVHNCDSSPAVDVNMTNFHSHYVEKIMRVLNS